MGLPSLSNIILPSAPYPIQGGVIRGVRTAIAFILAGVVTSIADGSLLNAVHIVPAGYEVFVTGALGTLMVTLDKYLREKGLIDQAAEDAAGLTLGDHVEGGDVSVVDVPAPAVNVDSGAPTEVPTSGDAETGTDAVPEDAIPLDDPESVNPTEFDDPVDSV